MTTYIPPDDPLERIDEEEINESANVPSIYYGPLDHDGYLRWDTEDLEISSPEAALINHYNNSLNDTIDEGLGLIENN